MSSLREPASPKSKERALPGDEFAGMNVDLMSAELSSRRTGLSFQRTRLSAERTLMSTIRTALALIGFGFTVFTFFRSLQTAEAGIVSVNAGRNFGLALVFLGTGLLVLGVIYHLRFMSQLRAERKEMVAQGIVHGQSGYPVSFTLIVAGLLFLLGLLALFSMLTRMGPFN